MNRENWQQVKQIFQSAIELAPEQRNAFLTEACAGDNLLRREVELLLDSLQSNFLEKPAISKIAERILGNSFAAGQIIGHYEITKKLGSGGMGEVYLAKDKRLNRLVAIKFLLPSSIHDGKVEKRLLREAQSAAMLDHPNICAIHEIGKADGRSFIVMQYVEGETLEQRIKRKNLSIGEALTIALQIADALCEAHTRGIIHRDIKPANVIISPRGQVKVLDFSLAKKVFIEAEDSAQSLLSVSGTIAGTIAYMSPEQARGYEIDSRSDIWSLGVVFYEMLTGRLPFAGETKSDCLAAILRSEPAHVKSCLPNLPDQAEHIIGKALQKNPEDRYQTAHDLLTDIVALRQQLGLQNEFNKKDLTIHSAASLKQQTSQPSKVSSKGSVESDKSTTSVGSITDENETKTSAESIEPKNKYRKIAFLAVILVMFAGAVVWKITQSNTSKPFPFSADSRSTMQITTLFNTKRKSGAKITSPVFSPDGNLLAFTFFGEGKSNIYLKQINGGEPIRVTDGKWIDQYPVWAPDGQHIAFVSNRDNKMGIWTVSFLGGAVVLLKALDLPSGTPFQLKKWSNDGQTIYYELYNNLYTFNLASGQTALITSTAHRNSSEQFSISPDEKMFAYVFVEGEKAQIWIQSLEGGEPRKIKPTDNSQWFPAWFHDSRYLAYSSDQNGIFQIYAVDIDGGETTQITFRDSDADSDIKPVVSPDGLKIAFVLEKNEANIYSYDLENNKETAQTANIALQIFPDVSPDGKQVAYQVRGAKFFESSIKIKSLETESDPLTVTKGANPKWSPNSQTFAFIRYSDKLPNLWKIDANGENEKQLTSSGILMHIFSTIPYNLTETDYSWSPDGGEIAYSSQKSGHSNLWTISSDGSNERMQTLNSDGNLELSSPLWSPKRNKIAYVARITPKASADKQENRVCIAEAGQNTIIFKTDLQMRLLGWSAKGTEVFIALKNGTDIEIFELSINSGENPKPTTRLSGAYLHGVKFSPVANRIAFAARRDGKDNIYLVASNGGDARQISANLDESVYYSGLTWLPSGKTLYYSKQTGGLQISIISNPEYKENQNV
ncbi:MAG TPA: protein kinase [Pyrinomonadaceae bacterium]|jgi:Tol biopolymer transport system component/tRNA A-37 threonylcarbamoyl transferase component Bud32